MGYDKQRKVRSLGANPEKSLMNGSPSVLSASFILFHPMSNVSSIGAGRRNGSRVELGWNTGKAFPQITSF